MIIHLKSFDQRVDDIKALEFRLNSINRTYIPVKEEKAIVEEKLAKERSRLLMALRASGQRFIATKFADLRVDDYPTNEIVDEKKLVTWLALHHPTLVDTVTVINKVELNKLMKTVDDIPGVKRVTKQRLSVNQPGANTTDFSGAKFNE